jgi:hypothetical protein
MHRSGLAFAFLIAACNAGLPNSQTDPTSQPPTSLASPTNPTCVTTMRDTSSVSGSFAGPELAGALCSGSTYASLEQTPNGITTSSSLILFINTQGTNACSVQTPTGGYDCDLQISATVPMPSPGTYQSGAGAPCDSLLFTATAPPSVTSCGGVSAPAQCPPGCAYGASPEDLPGGGAPCVPTPGPSVQYTAKVGGLCLDTETYAQLGSWTLTLTSVMPEGGSTTEGTYYDAHGSMTATMISGHDPYTGATDPIFGDNTAATLSISF